MYRIAICDDNEYFMAEFCQRLSAVLSRNRIEAEIGTFYDTGSLWDKMESGSVFDLVFLDILFEEEDGYSFARRLRSSGIETDIIFVTVTQEYAVEGYEVAPLLYLLKPVTDEKIEHALDVFLKKHTPQKILLNFSGEVVSFDSKDVLYCDVYGHKTSIHFVSGETKEVRYALTQLESHFPSRKFARSHSSYLVNMEHINRIARYRLTLDTGAVLPISQSKYLDLQNKFILYSSGQRLGVE